MSDYFPAYQVHNIVKCGCVIACGLYNECVLMSDEYSFEYMSRT